MDRLVLRQFTLGPLETNCYIIYSETTRQAVVIDPGMDCEPLLAALEGLSVTDVLLTHAHFDHIAGVGPVKERTQARVWVHAAEAGWLADPARNGSALWLDTPVTAPPADRLLHGGETLSLLGTQVKVLFTPGHSPGHVAYHWGGFVMSGDALFAGSIGRTDLSGGDYETLLRSIEREFLSLPDDTVLLPGHGPRTTVGTERRLNPFLRRG